MNNSNLTEVIFDEAVKVEDGIFTMHDGERYFRFDRIQIKAKGTQLEILYAYKGAPVYRQYTDTAPDFSTDDELHIEDIRGVMKVKI